MSLLEKVDIIKMDLEVTEHEERWNKLKNTIKGPWCDEPYRADFTYKGYLCSMRRGPSYAWCGYLYIPYTHPWHPEYYVTKHITPGPNFHGGITAGDFSREAIVGKRIPDLENDPVYLNTDHEFGFDCNHLGDEAPDPQYNTRDGAYRTMEYTLQELINGVDEAGKALEVEKSTPRFIKL